MKNRFVLLVLIAVSIAIGLGVRLHLWPDESREQGKALPPLRIGLDLWPGYLPAIIAAEKGLFTKSGVTVQLKKNNTVAETVADMRNGDVDGLFAVFSDIIILHTEGVQTKVVYISDVSQSGDVIIGRPELKSLADLKGRTVSFERTNSISHIYVLRALEAHGLDEVTVQFEIVPPADVLTALEEKRIHAGHTWQPTTSKALAKGYKILSKAGDFPGIITDILAFSAQTIAERPDDIQAVVNALWDAQTYINTHKDDSLAIGAAYLGMSEEELASGLSGIIQFDRHATNFALTNSNSPYSLRESGELILNFLLKRGQLRRIPDLNIMIEANFSQDSQPGKQK